MRGVHFYIGWTHIPDMDTHTSGAEDNQFAAPKEQPVGEVSVNLPTDNWLCRKMHGFEPDTHLRISAQKRDGVYKRTSL